MQHTSIIAILKKKKAAHNYGTIYIRGFFNRKPIAAISTGYKVLISNWDADNRCVLANAPNAKLINTCINSQLQQMQKKLLQIEIMGNPVNRRHIKSAVKGQDAGIDFIKFCSDNIKQKYTNDETIRTYNSELTKLQKFQTEISFADIDYKFLTDYKAHMRDVLKNVGNTIWKTFKFMRTMINDAMKQGGIIIQDPFEEFDRGNYEQTTPVFLSVEECNKMYELMNNENIPVIARRVALYFLLMCFSGLRFEDAMSFNPETHIIDNTRLVRRTSKGKGSIINIKLYNRLREIIALVKLYPLNISNKEFNKWMKIATALAGIEKDVTAHAGRHTFGSLLVDMGVPMEKAQMLLGHADIRATKIYYHIKQKNVDDEADKLNAI
jgi:site-specific recombinase XerD